MAYLEEADLEQVRSNRSACAICGEQHCIEAPRGQRLNVMAALCRRRLNIDWLSFRSAATAFLNNGSVIHSHCWCSSTAEIFLGFVGALAKKATKPLIIVINNASIHHARSIQPALRLLEKKGIPLRFLPPYSPELNRIEIMWWLMKHRWMALARRTKVEMEQAVDHVFTRFGGQLKMNF